MNVKQRKLLIIIISVCILIFTTFFLYFFIKVNQKYPPQKTVTHTVDESFSLNNFTITITGKDIYTIDELCQKYEIGEDVASMLNISPTRICLVNAEMYYQGEKSNLVSDINQLINQSNLEYGAFSNAVYIDLVNSVNTNLHLEEIKEYQNFSLLIPFSVPQSLLSADLWNKVDKLPVQLSFGIYPLKTTIKQI